ncbi:MAG TPA: hypothetical protein EYH17_02815 [Pyrodictium sp.]|nr:hypothetical protein [Pyrodictium sp.]
MSSSPQWLPRKIAFTIANKGYYVSLHSTSMFVMDKDMYVASIHVYPLDRVCIARFYKYNKRILEHKIQILSLLEKFCAKVEHKLVPLED